MTIAAPVRALTCALSLVVATSALSAEAPSAPSAQPARVELFSPQGTARQVRQVTARFSTAIVALGDPRLPDPFTVDCPASASGQSRWVDLRVWVYDFASDLPAGVACRFVVRPGLKALDGRAVTQATFRFDTGGPAITASFPYEGWSALDEDQIFLLRLDAPATPTSIGEHAYCVIEGLSERVPLRVLTGEERRRVLEQRAALGYAYYEILWKSGRTSRARVRDRSLEQAEAEIVVASCARPLPPAARVQLVWGAGIAAESGIATRQDQQLAFQVRTPFTAQVECARVNAESGCIPFQPIIVRFSAPIPFASAERVILRGPGNKELRRAPPPASKTPMVEEVRFNGPFPDAQKLTLVLPPDLKDDAGRPLQNAARFPLDIDVDEYPPLVKFSGEFGILEAREGGVLPVTLRNVEDEVARRQKVPARKLRVPADARSISTWLAQVEAAAEPKGEWRNQDNAAYWYDTTGTESVFGDVDRPESFTIDKPLGKRPSEVIGIPLGKPGFYVVEIESRTLGNALLGRDETRYVATSALVTNLSVHFLWGRESSRVWVTQLDTARPVAGAHVVVSDFCTGDKRWEGRTGSDGLATIDAALGAPHDGDRCNSWRSAPLLVTAQMNDDTSFTLSGWSQGIAPHDFGLSGYSSDDTSLYHSVLDRPLFRAGETVSMKHFLRRHAMQGVDIQAQLPGERRVTIAHQGSDQRYELKAQFGADGIAVQQWAIPKEARLGDYQISVQGPKDQLYPAGRFKVEEYRLPTMRATVQAPARPLVNARSADLDLHVAFLSGGGAGGLPVTVRSVVEPRALSFPDYEDYRFDGEPVVEGIVESSGARWDYDFDGSSEVTAGKARVIPLTLDAQGAARVTIPELPALTAPAQLVAELEYADANGEILTSASRVRLLPADVSLGLRSEGWVASKDQLRFRVVAVDVEGRAISGQRVDVALYRAVSYSYRKRLIGGFYNYETVRETTKLATACSGPTNAQGLLLCDVKPGVSGEVLVRAETSDARGNKNGATMSMWVAGDEDWWFGGTSGDRMDVLPEQKEYQPGDIARFQVRMPFKSATALVSVEREGVVDSFVANLKGREPIIEVPMSGNYAPNVYVSVLALRGRVARSERSRAERASQGPDITGLVDLNKPAYRLGLTQVKVGWQAHRLNVRVLPERDSYRVRENAQIKVQVAAADGKALPAGAEVAIAAVDESLLELASNPSWALLDAMMGQRNLEVWAATAQGQVVGKRHYGRKAVPHGGGGGRERAREMFDSLLLWQPRLPLNAAGEATITVPLNDSLSSFRIVAVAHAGSARFGTGEASIATKQDIILLSGLPPLVREADRYAATFTLRNTTADSMDVEVNAALPGAALPPLQAQRVTIGAGEARDVSWSVRAPVGASELKWSVSARALSGGARDRIEVRQTVIPAFPVRTYQATIAQLTEAWSLPAERPAAAQSGRGGLEISLRGRLGGNLDGVREYMSYYSYTCLEQNLSRAVALRDRSMWDAWMRRLPAYQDRDGLLRYFPSERLEGEDVLTAYVLAIAHEAGWEIPENTRERLTNALVGFVEGRIVRRSALPTADLAVRKLTALDALSRYDAATPDMLDSLTIEPNLWPTSAVLDWLQVLRRVKGISRGEARRNEAEGILRARLNFQGTTMGFSTARADALWWLMVSEDSNAVRLLLAVLDRPQWREDMPRLVRGALGRQQRGHWNTTVANAWGVLAFEKFSRAFESTPVTGATQVQYGDTQKSVTLTSQDTPAQLELPWRNEPATLNVQHGGSGAPWIMVRATAAMPLERAFSSGYTIRRTVAPVTQQMAGRWQRGDVMRVRLEIEAQSDMSWVVVEDPVPGGAAILGAGLGGQSQILQQGEQREGWVSPAFEERRFEAFRAYYRFVPKGRWTVEYTVRLNNPGTFALPATRVEAMYAPEMLGELPNATVTVEAAR